MIARSHPDKVFNARMNFIPAILSPHDQLSADLASRLLENAGDYEKALFWLRKSANIPDPLQERVTLGVDHD